MTDAVVARSAKLGDCCVRDIPRLLSKEEIRDLAQIDSVKFTAAAVLEFGLIAAAVWISETWWNPLIYVLAVIVIGSPVMPSVNSSKACSSARCAASPSGQ